MEPVLVFLCLVWVFPILVGQHLGISRDRTGWAWGLLLGWLGVFILALMRPIPVNDRQKLNRLGNPRR